MNHLQPMLLQPPSNETTIEHLLSVGNVRFGAAPLRLSTLLGSCVAVTLWLPRRRIGGMCHFLVPIRTRTPGMGLDGLFADEAFALFDQAMAEAGGGAGEYQAKLFGGGHMFSDDHNPVKLGMHNIAVARTLLKQRGITLLAEHVGGTGHRRLIFDLTSGEVQIRFVDQARVNGDG